MICLRSDTCCHIFVRVTVCVLHFRKFTPTCTVVVHVQYSPELDPCLVVFPIPPVHFLTRLPRSTSSPLGHLLIVHSGSRPSTVTVVLDLAVSQLAVNVLLLAF